MRVVVISDVHCGSHYAVFPPNYFDEDTGTMIIANEWQQKLYEEWERLANELSPVDIIVLLGDVVEGNETKAKFKTLILPNIQQQAKAFLKLMEPWKWRKIFVVIGTTYHVTSDGFLIEDYIAHRLNAEIHHNKRAFNDLPLEIKGKTVHFAHGISYSKVPHYQATPLARELWLMRVNDDYYGKFDLIVRGHVHYYMLLDRAKGAIITCPCWQYPTPYQRKLSVFGARADLGIVELIFNERGYGVEKHLIELQKPEVVKIEDETEVIKIDDKDEM